MEELVLTDPVVEPEKVTSKFHVLALLLNHGAPSQMPNPEQIVTALVKIDLVDNLGKAWTYSYTGQTALDYIKFINTANFTTKSLHKRILERLASDGVLPGTVTGTPDPPAERATQG
jgi:hypothetical protein